jgi:hypothetical protein
MSSSVTFLPLSSPFLSISRAKRAPKKPAPPVKRIQIIEENKKNLFFLIKKTK